MGNSSSRSSSCGNQKGCFRFSSKGKKTLGRRVAMRGLMRGFFRGR